MLYISSQCLYSHHLLLERMHARLKSINIDNETAILLSSLLLLDIWGLYSGLMNIVQSFDC